MSDVKVKCPTCKKETVFNSANVHRPFCSERCKLIDLGAWAAEEHSIPGEPLMDDLMSEDIDKPKLH